MLHEFDAAIKTIKDRLPNHLVTFREDLSTNLPICPKCNAGVEIPHRAGIDEVFCTGCATTFVAIDSSITETDAEYIKKALWDQLSDRDKQGLPSGDLGFEKDSDGDVKLILPPGAKP